MLQVLYDYIPIIVMRNGGAARASVPLVIFNTFMTTPE